METLDSLTNRFGMGAVKLGSQQTEKPEADLTNLQPLRNETTNIEDIIKVK